MALAHGAQSHRLVEGAHGGGVVGEQEELAHAGEALHGVAQQTGADAAALPVGVDEQVLDVGDGGVVADDPHEADEPSPPPDSAPGPPSGLTPDPSPCSTAGPAPSRPPGPSGGSSPELGSASDGAHAVSNHREPSRQASSSPGAR